MKGSNEKTIKSLPIGISDYVRAQSEYYYVVKKLVEDLRQNYNTRNPFELAEKYGIRVVVSKMLTIDRKAYTIRSDNYLTIIIINGRYEHKSQLVLCAHELGHALLHSDAVR